MKHKLKLLPLLAILIGSAFFIQCAKDDAGLYDENARQFGPQIDQPVEYLQGAKKQQAINLLKARMANGGLQRNIVGWTVDFSEVMQVTDSLGNVNFTYRINHPGVSENIFYNLVHTETKGYSTVKLLRYHMQPEFAVEYYRGTKDIADFAGMIKVTPLTHTRDPLPEPVEPEPVEPNEPPKPPDEPCEQETTIVVLPQEPNNPVPGPISPPGGGYSSANGGTNGDLSFFYELSQLELPDGPSCFRWEKTKCGAQQDHYSATDSRCRDEQKGYVTLVNDCTGQTMQVIKRNGSGNAGTIKDPCELIGQIGVLSPYSTYRLANKIVNQIDDSELDTCSKEVLNELKGLTQNSMVQIISKLDNAPSVYKMIIKTEDFVSADLAQTYRTDFSSIPYRYTIRMKKSYVQNSTQLSIARTLIHEIIHAYLLSMIDDEAAGTNPGALDDFPQLFEKYVQKKHGINASVAQHEDMAHFFVDIIATAIQEYHTGAAVIAGQDPLEIYQDLAWGGLEGTAIYNTLFPVGDPARIRMYKRRIAEDIGEQYGEYNPISTKCN